MNFKIVEKLESLNKHYNIMDPIAEEDYSDNHES